LGFVTTHSLFLRTSPLFGKEAGQPADVPPVSFCVGCLAVTPPFFSGIPAVPWEHYPAGLKQPTFRLMRFVFTHPAPRWFFPPCSLRGLTHLTLDKTVQSLKWSFVPCIARPHPAKACHRPAPANCWSNSCLFFPPR